MADAAEKIKDDLLQTLQTPDRWTVPILLRLRPPEAQSPEIRPVDLHFSQTGAGLKIQLDLLIPRDFDPAILRRETMRALLLEMSYRSLPNVPAGQPYTTPPNWLVEGLLAATSGAAEAATARLSQHSMPLIDILKQRPSLLDSTSRALYCASAGGLIRLLVSGADGRARLSGFIKDLPLATGEPLRDLRQHFPQLGTDGETEKAWGAFLAHEQVGFALASFTKTSSRLDELLRIKIGRPRGGKQQLTLSEVVDVGKAEIDRAAALEVGRHLALLAAEAHPLLRPIVIDYTQIVEALLARKIHGLRQRLESTAALRRRVSQRMDQVDDYMNWFEATQARSASGSFGGYLQAVGAKENLPHRRDPISVYLDALESQFH
ncbi:MAG: hypothetical protein ABI839_00665 [Verrucomicrobiota bacterium]